jgi:hypothetical protein
LIQGGRKSDLWPNPQYPFINFSSSNGSWFYPDGSFEADPKKNFDRMRADPKTVWVQVVCGPFTSTPPYGQVEHSAGVPTAPAPPQVVPGVSPTPGGGGGASVGDGQIMIALKRHKGSLAVIAGGLAVLLYLRRGKRKRR